MHFSTFPSYSFLFSLLVLIGLNGCSTDAAKTPPLGDGTFSKIASVPSTNVETLNSSGSLLLAGTNQGAYKKGLGDSEAGWVQAGLDIDSAKIVDFVILNEQNLLAAVMYDEVRTNKPTLFKSNNNGDSWSPVNITKPEELDFFVIHDLERQMGSSVNLFAYVGRIVRSSDGGNTWEIVYEEGGFSTFLTVSKFQPNKVWTGGSVTIFAPYLAKSENGGDNWQLLNDNFYFNSDATVYDVVVHPQDPGRVLVGVGGSVNPANVIRLSTDGGENWETVYEGVNTRTLAHSALGNGRVYASGRNADGSLFFVASADFGNTWEMVKMEGEPLLVQINDLVSVMEDGREVLYLGTDQGVYSYTFEE